MVNIIIALHLEEWLELPFRERHAVHAVIAFVVIMTAGIPAYITFS